MEEAKSSKSVTRGAGAPSSSQVDEERKGEAEVAAIPAGKESRAESDEEDITLGPGWMNRSGSRTLTLSGTRDFAKGSSSGVVPIAGGSKLLAYCYTKEDVLALHSAVADECPPDFLALPYILSEEPLLPVNLSQDLLKDVRLRPLPPTTSDRASIRECHRQLRAANTSVRAKLSHFTFHLRSSRSCSASISTTSAQAVRAPRPPEAVQEAEAGVRGPASADRDNSLIFSL